MPDVSIVIPAYRAEATIARTLTSILMQPNIMLDIIVVVDGLFDETARIASAFSGVRVLVNETNEGAQLARNRGLAAARANYVHFLDADDYIEGQLHAGMIEALERDQSDVVLVPWIWERPEHRGGRVANFPALLRDNLVTQEDLVAWWLSSGGTPTAGSGWRTQALQSIGGWDPEIRRAQDFDVGLRGIIAGLRVTMSSDGAYIYVDHDSTDRITRSKIGPTIRSQMKTIATAEAFASSLPDPCRVLTSAGLRCYHIASRCFLEGSTEEGRTMLGHARRLGFDDHVGTRYHKALAAFIGLEAKQNLSRLRTRLRNRGRA